MNSKISDYILSHSGVYYCYDMQAIQNQIDQVKSLQWPYGTIYRYAMKANPMPEILELMRNNDIRIDACSEHEAKRAIELWYDPKRIQLSAQQLPLDLASMVASGIEFVATSFHQLESYGKLFPWTKVGIRLNPGLWDGQFAKVNVAGKESGFGIWREYLDKIDAIVTTYNLTIHKIHTHIWSGTNPDTWWEVAGLSLQLCNHFPHVERLNLGWWFKVARVESERSADMKIIWERVYAMFQSYYEKTGRKIHLEIEPGTFYVANAGYIACDVIDLVDTGKGGYHFARLNTGMDMIVRPTMYGSQHPIMIAKKLKSEEANMVEVEEYNICNTILPNEEWLYEYVFIGHCCESSDLLTPSKDNPNALYPRTFDMPLSIGDRVIIWGCGAYCQSMSMKWYNGWPEMGYRIL